MVGTAEHSPHSHKYKTERAKWKSHGLLKSPSPTCDTPSIFKDNACTSGSDIWAVLTPEHGKEVWLDDLGRQEAQGRYLEWRVLQTIPEAMSPRQM